MWRTHNRNQRLIKKLSVTYTPDVRKGQLVTFKTAYIFSALWKKYYKTVNIPARKNLRTQRNFMPVRYWEFLTEEP